MAPIVQGGRGRMSGGAGRSSRAGMAGGAGRTARSNHQLAGAVEEMMIVPRCRVTETAIPPRPRWRFHLRIVPVCGGTHSARTHRCGDTAVATQTRWGAYRGITPRGGGPRRCVRPTRRNHAGKGFDRPLLACYPWLCDRGVCHGRVSRGEVAMDPIVIPISFVAILVVAGLVTHGLASREERRNR